MVVSRARARIVAATRLDGGGECSGQLTLFDDYGHRSGWMEASPASRASSGSPRQVSKSHFKAHALELFRQVEASGEPLVVTDHGRPSIEVRPYRPAGYADADPLELLRGSVLRFDEPFEPVGENDWEALA